MFARFSRSWNLVKASAAVLMQDKELLLFPLISTGAMVVVFACFAVPILGLGALDGLSGGNDGRISAKPVLPARIADHGIRIRSRLLVFGGREKATESRTYPKYLEVVAGCLVAPDSCIRSGVAERHHRNPESDQSGKSSSTIPKIAVIGVTLVLGVSSLGKEDQLVRPLDW